MRSMSVFLFTVLLFTSCNQSERATMDIVPYLHWESNSIQSNGIRLHYWRTGGIEKPTMIMSHGLSDYGLLWASLAAKFEKDYDIIMYDARGHGFSEKPEGPYDLTTHVQDLMGLIRILEIRKPILMGHSMGGSIVMKTAADYPDVPTAIIMIDPPMEEALEQLTPDIMADWKEYLRTQNQRPKDELIKEARTEYHPGYTYFEYDHWAEAKHLVVPEVIDILEGEGFGNPRDLFAEISTPTLLLKADTQEEEYRKRHIEAAALLPNGKVVHVEGAGHLIHLDKPMETEQEIRTFLNGLSL